MQHRPVADLTDLAAVRRLLVATYPHTPLGWNWEVRRWDGLCFYREGPVLPAAWTRRARAWVDESGLVVAAVHPEGDNDVHFQLHPAHRHLEPEMLAWAEEHCRAPVEAGGSELAIEVQETDTERRALLLAHGFTPTDGVGYIRRLALAGQPIHTPDLPPGYQLRTTDPADPADCRAIAALLNAAFGRTGHTGDEYANFARRAPSFRADLDLVAVAPDGVFGAYVGIPYEPTNRLGVFEPVCTHPDHRRRGLARALMLEGIRRLQSLGAEAVMVGTGDMEPANRLYDALGFTEKVQGTQWRRRWP